MAAAGVPMGVLATIGDEPVGWGACGPRSRYLGATPSRHPLLGDAVRAEDETAWLLPCVFVHAEHRSQGVSHALVEGAVALARARGAVALEGWPSSGPQASPADAFVGHEGLFVELGFRRTAQPVPGRALVRLDLAV
jgi:GNAT superfamily N-acetyltransferase